jgi:hypothetical protein
MLGAEEPATSRISSTEAVPVRRRNLIISSQRALSVSDISHRFYPLGGGKIKPEYELIRGIMNIFADLLKSLTNFIVYDRFLGQKIGAH